MIEPAGYDGPCYNVWSGFAVAPREGDPSLFLRYIADVLCSGDAELARWIVQYLADAVQRPTEPSPPTAIAIRGPQGQGKTFLFKLLKRIFGRAAREVASSDRLFARFNRSIVGCTIIGAEEAIFSGDPRLAQVLKTFISSDLWTYEEKYRATLEMKNVHRLIATTNSEHAVLIEEDDRRWTVIEVPKRWDIQTEEGRREATAFWEPFYDFLRGDGPAILNHLLGLEVDQSLIRFAFVNSTKADDKIMSDPVLQFLDEVAETLTLPHDRDGKGVASIQSIVGDVRGRSPQARHMNPEAISVRIRKIVPHAERVRTGHYVERAQMDQNGTTQYLEKTRLRGIAFGSPDEFRAAVAKITRRDYGRGGEWEMWRMQFGWSEPGQHSEEAVEELLARVVSPVDEACHR